MRVWLCLLIFLVVTQCLEYLDGGCVELAECVVVSFAQDVRGEVAVCTMD